jgi:diguanylate cyclase (GGDEF)-like protein
LLLARPCQADDTTSITDPGAFLDQTESVRITDHAQFAQRLAQIHREAPKLTAAQQWHLTYLDALEASLQGKYAVAEEPLHEVIDHSGSQTLAAKASALLMNNLAIRHRYLEAFTLAHKLTSELPGIQDRAVRFEVLSYLSQMLNLAGQTDLAIKYAQMMEQATPPGISICAPRLRLMAARYNAGKLVSSDPDLRQTISICKEARQPIVQTAAELILSTLYLEEKQPAKALALLDQIAASIKRNHYYPHALSAQVQRAQAYEQLGRESDAKQAALAAVAMAGPREVDNSLVVAYMLLFKIAKRNGDATAALSYYEHYVTQEKSSVDDAAAQALAYQTVQQQVLTRKLETEELSKQNSILKLQQALDAKAVETSRLYIVLLLILLASIAFWLYRLKRSQLRFKKLASHDGLTGILNHQHFIGECERILRALEKRGAQAGLVSIDLDHFKQINDTYGHATGDTVLRHAVAVCMEHLRPGDLFGRLGGEEFGVLLADCGRDQALAIADRIRLTIVANPLAIDGEIVTISASVGVSFTANAGHDLQQLCREADAALYRAKRSGRNRVMADTEDDGLVQA